VCSGRDLWKRGTSASRQGVQLVGTTEDGRGWGGRRFTARGELGILNKSQNATLGHASQHSSVVER